MSDTCGRASNAGLNSEDGLEGTDKSTSPRIESGQEVVDEKDSPPLSKASAETGKREVNIPFRAFGTNFSHSFDAIDNSGLVAFARHNHDDANVNESITQSCQKTSAGNGQNHRDERPKLSVFHTNNTGTNAEDLHKTQHKFASDSSVPQSELSFNNQDGDKSSDTSSLSPDEDESVNDHRSNCKEDFVSSKPGEALCEILPSEIMDLPLGRTILTSMRRLLNPATDLVHATPNQTRETLLMFLLTKAPIKLLTAFFEFCTEIVQSGSRKDQREYVASPLFCYITAKDGVGQDGVPVIHVEVLKAIVEDISSSSIDELDHRCTRNQNTGSSRSHSESLTPPGVLKDKKKTFQWVLCRQMGFLKPKSFETLHTLYPTGFLFGDTEIPMQMFRQRAAYNIKGRWYSIRASRMVITKYFDAFKNSPEDSSELRNIPPPELVPRLNRLLLDYKLAIVDRCLATYLGATEWAETCLQHQELIKTGGEKLLGYPLPIEEVHNKLEKSGELLYLTTTKCLLSLTEDDENHLPSGWQEICDGLGRICWVHVFYTMTYKLPKAEFDVEAVINRRELKIGKSFKGSQPPDETGQTSSPSSTPNQTKVKKSLNGIQSQEKPGIIQDTSFEPESDEIDNNLVLLRSSPDVYSMLSYFSGEDWFKLLDLSSLPSLPPSVSSIGNLLLLRSDQVFTRERSGRWRCESEAIEGGRELWVRAVSW